MLTQQTNVQEMSHRCHVTEVKATVFASNQLVFGRVRVNWSSIRTCAGELVKRDGHVSAVLFSEPVTFL
jgi:hypothetical protein